MEFKGSQFGKNIILTCVLWYLRYNVSYRDLEEMMTERGVEVDHSTIYRWVIKYSRKLLANFRQRKKPCSNKWKMDETYIRIKGKYKYLYRAIDDNGETIDFLLCARRDRKAAIRFFKKAIKNNDMPVKVNIDKSGANKSGLNHINSKYDSSITITQVKYLNNLIEQDHRFIKRKLRSIQCFKSFHTARITLDGMEMVNMIKKGQLKNNNDNQNLHKQFFSLAA